MNFIRKHKVISVILLIISIYIYYNFTIPVETNKLDKNSYHYVNDLYESDGRIYKMLDKDEKKMYRTMYENSKKYNKKIKFYISEYNCTDYNECGELVDIAHFALHIDHPELFNYESYRWVSNETEFKLTLDFAIQTKITDQIALMKTERVLAKIKEETKNMNDLEKIQYVYDWIGTKKYDKLTLGSGKNQTIYNFFMHNKSVCLGFAKASQIIFQNIGINSYIAIGDKNGSHAWNIVEYKDKYYYFDASVAASIKDKKSSYYYEGLVQEKMNDYQLEHPDWYPEIEIENVFH